MKLSIENIEKRLKEFFEYDLHITQKRNPLNEISELILEEMGKNVVSAHQKTYAPNIFRITTKKSDLFEKEAFESWKSYFAELILLTAKENRISLAGPVHIQIYHHPGLPTPFQINSDFSTIPTGKTVNIITRKPSGKKTGELKNAYIITSDETIYPLNKPIINIGRREDNDLVVDNIRVSRVHAQIRLIDGRHIIFDLDSTVGTSVNGQMVRQKELKSGDVIDIADVPIVYAIENDALAEKSDLNKHTRFLNPSNR
jgi:hypothetical protein